MSKKSKKVKATSILPMSATFGLIIGFALGAAGGVTIIGTIIGIIAGAALGYYVDHKNGLHAKRNH